MPSCPACGTDYIEGRSLCDYCGHEFAPIAVDPIQLDEPSQDGEIYYCDPSVVIDNFPGCGNSNPFIGGIECPDCGAVWKPEDLRRPPDTPPPAPTRDDPPKPPADQPPDPDPMPDPTPDSMPDPEPAADPTPEIILQPDPEPEPVTIEPATPPQSSIDGPRLVVEGPRAVVSNLDGGREVREIAFDVDQITVGCTDIYQSHYPDLDLLMFRANDPYLSRRHARFLREGNEYFVEVLTDADSTTFNNSEDVIGQDERRKLTPGDTVYFSHSLAIRYEY